MGKGRALEVLLPADIANLGFTPTPIGTPTIEFNPKEYKGINLDLAVTGGELALQEARAKSQTGAELIGKGIGNLVSTVAFDILRSPGNVYSFGASLAGNPEGIDNAYLQLINSIEEATTGKLFEVFRAPSMMEKGLWAQLSDPTFWASEGAQGVGTLLGFMLPGMVIKALGVGDKIARVLGKLGRLEDLVVDASTVMQTKGPNAFGNFLIKTLGKTGRGLDFDVLGRNISSGLAVGFNTVLEAGAEGVEAFEQFKAQGMSDDEAAVAARNVVLFNTALLTVSNTLLEKYIFNGFNRLPSSIKAFDNYLAKGATGIKPLQQALVKGTAGVIGEGFIEEGLQTTVVQAQGDPIRTLGKYLENVASLFSSDPDVNFGKSVALGSILGGGMSSVSGFSDARSQQSQLTGSGAFTPNRLQKALGMKAREASDGLIKVWQSNFDSVKLGKEAVKNFKDITQLEDSSVVFALANYHDDLVEKYNGDAKAAMTEFTLTLKENGLQAKDIQAIASAIGAPNQLSAQENLEWVKTNRDFMYFSRFASQPGGFDILNAHIEDMAEAMANRYEESTGVKLPVEKKTTITKELKDRAKVFEEMYNLHKGSASNSRLRLTVPKGKEQDLAVFLATMRDQAVALSYKKAHIEERLAQLSTTKDYDAEIDNIKAQKEALEKKLKGIQDANDPAFQDTKDEIKSLTEKATALRTEMQADQSHKDRKIYEATIIDINKSLVEITTAEGLAPLWKKRQQIEEELEAEIKKSQYTINDIEVDPKSTISFLPIISKLKELGYDVNVTEDGTFMFDSKRIYFRSRDKVYGVNITTDPDGKFRVEVRDSSKPGSTPAIYNSLSGLISDFKNIEFITLEEGVKAYKAVEEEIKKEQLDLFKKATYEAFNSVMTELNERILGLRDMRLTKKSEIKLLESDIKKLKGRKNSKAYKEAKAKIENQIRTLQAEIEQINFSITVANNTFSNLTKMQSALVSLTVQLSAENTQQAFDEIRQSFESLMAPPTNPAEVSLDTYIQDVLGRFEEIFGQRQDEELKALIQDSLTQDMDDLALAIRDYRNALVNTNEENKNLLGLLKDMAAYIEKLEAEGRLTNVLRKRLPAGFKAKFPDAIQGWLNADPAKVNIDKIVDYYYSTDPDNAAMFMRELLDAYAELGGPLDSFVDYTQKRSEQIEADISKAFQQAFIHVANKLMYLKAHQEFASKISSIRTKVYNQLVSSLMKQPGQARDGRDPGDPTDSVEVGFNEDESRGKVTAMFNTSSRNIETDNNGDDIFDPIQGGKLLVPRAINDPIQQAFFRWLDTNPSGFLVEAYVPNWDETDFDRVSDPIVRNKLKTFIANAPQESRPNAVYALITDQNGDVVIYEGQPMITSVMLPDTKFPDGSKPRMADHSLFTLFLQALGNKNTVSRQDLNSEDKFRAKPDVLEAIKSLTGLEAEKMSKREFYAALAPYAYRWGKDEYTRQLNEIVEKSKTETLYFEVESLSNGHAVFGLDENGTPAKFDTVEALGLRFIDDSDPANFSLYRADYKGFVRFGTSEKGGFKPGRAYVSVDGQGLVPIETAMLDDNEVETVLNLIAAFAGKNNLGLTLKDLMPKTDLSKFFYITGDGKKINMADLPVLPTKNSKFSVMGLFINWGYSADKKELKPYDIFIDGGTLRFGNEGGNIKLTDLKQALADNNETVLKPLKSFLQNKRLNANFSLLGSTKLFARPVYKKGKFEVQTFKQGYVRFLVDRSQVPVLPKEILDKHNLPRHAQRALHFKPPGQYNKPTAAQMENLGKVKPAPKSKSKASETASQPPVTKEFKDKAQELLDKLNKASDPASAMLVIAPVLSTDFGKTVVLPAMKGQGKAVDKVNAVQAALKEYLKNEVESVIPTDNKTAEQIDKLSKAKVIISSIDVTSEPATAQAVVDQVKGALAKMNLEDVQQAARRDKLAADLSVDNFDDLKVDIIQLIEDAIVYLQNKKSKPESSKIKSNAEMIKAYTNIKEDLSQQKSPDAAVVNIIKSSLLGAKFKDILSFVQRRDKLFSDLSVDNFNERQSDIVELIDNFISYLENEDIESKSVPTQEAPAVTQEAPVQENKAATSETPSTPAETDEIRSLFENKGKPANLNRDDEIPFKLRKPTEVLDIMMERGIITKKCN